MQTAATPVIVSAHADYGIKHRVFQRTQSREQSQRKWEHRLEPMLSWSQMLFPAAGALGVAVLTVGILH